MSDPVGDSVRDRVGSSAGDPVHVLGIRHHGPGSARAVAAALDELQPDAVLIEGPADAGPVLALAADPQMSPPVALLAYAVDEPGVSAFWPFAGFSPEWLALRWALARGVPVRFCDLPAANVLARSEGEHAPSSIERNDPLAMLASAAGYDDPERWWDDVIESRSSGSGYAESPFEAITEAMAELRAVTAAEPPSRQLHEDRREAYMRSQLRAARAEGARRPVVVCGAWHAPALAGRLPGKAPSAAADSRLLRGMPKRKVALTWVPWTHSRLATASGYGAGVTSPGWYQHLFSHPERTVARWLTRVARVLRAEDLPVSSANVIEAVRLADTLATLRGRQLAGLEEVTEATRSVLVDGDDVALALVTDRLVVGEALGGVPAETPTVPLEADLRARARTLRIGFEAVPRTLALDLRKAGDLSRSQLLHRLALLDVPWGVPAASAVRATGTFRETWEVCWRPELSVAVIEAAMWGSTLESAALAKLRDRAGQAGSTLPELTVAVEHCLLADLPGALPDLLAALDARAAVDLDLEHLTGALPALVRALRYGDVRGTDTGALARVSDALLTRICVALPQAVTGLDDEGSAALRVSVDAVHAAVGLLDQPAGRDRWFGALAGVIDRSDVHGLLVGRIVRLLRDAGRLPAGDPARRLSRALSVGSTAAAKAAWVEGFCSGGGLLLVHDRELLGLLDGWVGELPGTEFTDVLPLLRRTFGQFATGERRSIGERVSGGARARAAADALDQELDSARGGLAAATVAVILA